MEKDDLKEDLNKGKEYLNKGLAVSREALTEAGKAVSKFKDESALKIEIQQLKSQIKKDKAALGERACKAFIEEGAEALPADDEEVVKLLEDIRKAQSDIQEREDKLSGGK